MKKRTGKKVRLNGRDLQRKKNAAAMADVKRLVARHGRLAVGNCLAKIKARDKEAKRLAELKKQVAEMERGLR